VRVVSWCVRRDLNRRPSSFVFFRGGGGTLVRTHTILSLLFEPKLQQAVFLFVVEWDCYHL
jgi:hypothetical protein